MATSRMNSSRSAMSRQSKIIQYFRERWGPFGQPLDS